MTASEKIEKLLKHLNINAKVFSERLGYTRPQVIYDIQKGKTKVISPDLASKIISVYPEINKVWLLADEGDMLVRSENGNSHCGEHITHLESFSQFNESEVFLAALHEISEMRKALTKAMEVNQEHTTQLLAIISNITLK
jgi:hypothetical protein